MRSKDRRSLRRLGSQQEPNWILDWTLAKEILQSVLMIIQLAREGPSAEALYKTLVAAQRRCKFCSSLISDRFWDDDCTGIDG